MTRKFRDATPKKSKTVCKNDHKSTHIAQQDDLRPNKDTQSDCVIIAKKNKRRDVENPK